MCFLLIKSFPQTPTVHDHVLGSESTESNKTFLKPVAFSQDTAEMENDIHNTVMLEHFVAENTPIFWCKHQTPLSPTMFFLWNANAKGVQPNYDKEQQLIYVLFFCTQII